jgi:HEAT repeat protein
MPSSNLSHWQALAAGDPERLIAALSNEELPTWELSFAAEVAGCLPAARVPLLALLNHASPTVREGAIYGLAQLLDNDPSIRESLTKMTYDRSGAVREAATKALA